MTQEHSIFMRRCLEIALRGAGHVAPNPLVGSVLVWNGKIVGEGFHRQYGEAHAEVNAISSVPAEIPIQECTLYVNLEPCSHHGKTPPCADLIVRSGIKRVVIGTMDPNPLVAGNGIRKLRESGVEVITDIETESCLWLNRRFFIWQKEKRPYIILKWAQTQDGFMDKIRKAGERGVNWISSQATKRLVHTWRSEESAILIGAGTLVLDNPSLTVREVSGKNPVRIVLAGSHEIPPDSNVLKGDAPTIIFHNKKNGPLPASQHEFVYLEKETQLEQCMEHLFGKNLQSVIIEGGREVLESFIQKNLWDEARIIVGSASFGDGLPAPVITGTTHEIFSLGQDQIQIRVRT